jgi:hypothetical protein
MTEFCTTRWSLYDNLVRATEKCHGSQPTQGDYQEYRYALLILQQHKDTCELCQEHAEWLAAWSAGAVMPITDEEVEGLL